MLSIQIDTKSLYHQFNNIKLSFFARHMKSSFPLCMFDRCCTVIRYSRVACKIHYYRLQHFSCVNLIIKECVICFAMFHYHSPPLYLLSIIRRPKPDIFFWSKQSAQGISCKWNSPPQYNLFCKTFLCIIKGFLKLLQGLLIFMCVYKPSQIMPN